MIETADLIVADLQAALGAADVAAVLLRLADADDRTLINRVQALARTVQDSGAALLLFGRPELVAPTGADGAHLAGIDVFNASVSTLKPERIAGAGGLATRHDAMLAAEAGADYVMFGEPDASGHRPSLEAIIERVKWWAEVFQAPCIGFAETLEEIAPLVTAGADFIALGDFIFADPRGPSATLAAAAERLKLAEPVQ
ncbi:MAG: thiamine phosphate synthase [Pseudomonadota bacterium]|nr:thiamine phosphate synthase [Pseudomonadota bacterium]